MEHTQARAAHILNALAEGHFPMAESAESPDVYIVAPRARGILPLNAFHLPRRLRRMVRAAPFDITLNTDFDAVTAACATQTRRRATTWINAPIRDAYGVLHRDGHAHTIECRHEGRLVGGLYGVAMGGVFFGESMFSRMRDASKVALVYLVARLIAGGFLLLDAQFMTPHLAQFGAREIPQRAFMLLLRRALGRRGDFHLLASDAAPSRIIQLITQTS